MINCVLTMGTHQKWGYKQSKRHHQPEIGKKAPATRSVPISRCISIAEKYIISDWVSVVSIT